jgi:hypothetical protein
LRRLLLLLLLPGHSHERRGHPVGPDAAIVQQTAAEIVIPISRRGCHCHFANKRQLLLLLLLGADG